MSMGVPVISTGVGGIPYTVKDGESGFLVERNKEALKARVRQLYADRGLLARMAARSLEVFEAEFDIQRTAERYAGVYEEVTRV